MMGAVYVHIKLIPVPETIPSAGSNNIVANDDIVGTNIIHNQHGYTFNGVSVG
jgi:hypothetical protein